MDLDDIFTDFVQEVTDSKFNDPSTRESTMKLLIEKRSELREMIRYDELSFDKIFLTDLCIEEISKIRNIINECYRVIHEIITVAGCTVYFNDMEELLNWSKFGLKINVHEFMHEYSFSFDRVVDYSIDDGQGFKVKNLYCFRLINKQNQ